jgi:lysine-specific demethylase 3
VIPLIQELFNSERWQGITDRREIGPSSDRKLTTTVKILKQEKQRKKDGGSSNSSECGGNGRTNGEEKNSPLSWLADVALQNQDKNESDSDTDSDEDQDGNHSTLRELLIRPSQKPNGNGSRSNSPDTAGGNGAITTDGAASGANANDSNATTNSVTKAGKKSKMDTLNEVISSVIEHSVKVRATFFSPFL